MLFRSRRLGPWRYELLRRLQAVLAPPVVADLLGLPEPSVGFRLLAGLRSARALGLAPAARRLVIPRRHWKDLGDLERPRPSLSSAA